MKANRGSPIAICPQAETGRGGTPAVYLHAEQFNDLVKARLMVKKKITKSDADLKKIPGICQAF